MNTENLPFDKRSDRKVIEDFGEVPPGVRVTVLSHYLFVKSVGKGNLPGLVVSSKKSNMPRVLELQAEEKLQSLVSEQKRKDGIVDIKVWINRGELKVGDDIMLVLVAGRFRTDVVPVFESLLSSIKGEIVHERELG